MSAVLDRKLRQAAAAIAAGDLARAELLSREVLERAPRHPRALRLAAAARLEQGDGAGAGELLERALENDPGDIQVLEGLGAAALKAKRYDVAESWLRRAIGSGKASEKAQTWLGLALSSQKRSAEAIDVFRQAAVATPGDPGVHVNLGHELTKVGAWEDAEASYRRALRLRPDYPEAHNGLGSAQKVLGRLDEALASIQQAIALHPDYAEAYDALGRTLFKMNREDEAIVAFRRAIELDPDNADYHSDLGDALSDRRLFDEAIGQYRTAISLSPDVPEGHSNLASALMWRGEPEAAVESLRRALTLRPDFADAHNNLGLALMRLGKIEEGRSAFRRAIELEPDNANIHMGFANALKDCFLWDEALAQYARALEIKPGDPAVRFNRSFAWLYLQDFERGWQDHETRFEVDFYFKSSFRPNVAGNLMFRDLPRWRGPGEEGVRDVAVWAEQGVGDQVLYSTLIPELIESGVPFHYEVDSRLLDAYRRAFPEARFVPIESPIRQEMQQASRVLAAGSLQALFRTTRESFARQPRKVLSSLPDRTAHYRRELDALGPGLKVAVSWRSARMDYVVKKKTAPLADFAPLLGLPGTHWVDVQYGDTLQERAALQAAHGIGVRHFDGVDYTRDLEEVLAILDACDLLVTTSNATAHFAGALGKRTWLLYLEDRAPFYYWVHGGTGRSLWYPSVEIISAPHLNDWASLALYVRDRLLRELPQS